MIELWLVDLEAAGPSLEAVERNTPRLSEDDSARAGRLASTADRRHRLAAYTALRIALERAGGPSLRGRPLLRSATGKPGLPLPGPAFSVAHTAGLALIGVTSAPAIGVDLELTRKLRMSQRRQSETLAVGEGLFAGEGTAARGVAGVLQAWCRLEAFGKATGKGISGVLRELGLREAEGRDLPLAQIRIAARSLAGAERLLIADLALAPGLYGAVACARAPGAAQVRRFPTDAGAIAELATARAW
jgi:4'-phosphopantetheinyl transferase